MTKEQIESMLADDMVIILCRDGREKLETYNLIHKNLDIPLGICATSMVKHQEVNQIEHLAIGYVYDSEDDRAYMTAWREDSTIIKERERISFDEFARLIHNMGETEDIAEDTSIEEDFMRLFA